MGKKKSGAGVFKHRFTGEEVTLFFLPWKNRLIYILSHNAYAKNTIRAEGFMIILKTLPISCSFLFLLPYPHCNRLNLFLLRQDRVNLSSLFTYFILFVESWPFLITWYSAWSLLSPVLLIISLYKHLSPYFSIPQLPFSPVLGDPAFPITGSSTCEAGLISTEQSSILRCLDWCEGATARLHRLTYSDLTISAS